MDADSVTTTSNLLGTNLFLYCYNNPVNSVDSTGNFSIKISGKGKLKNSLQGLHLKENKGLKNQQGGIIVSKGLPTTGEPGSSQTLPNPDGSIKQKRWYGPDGNAERDRDYNHSGDVPFPHDHEWNDGVRGKAHLPPSPEYEFSRDPAISHEPVIGVGVVTVCIIGMGIIIADDATGVGIADDVLLEPLSIGVGEGLIMIFE